MANPVNLSGTMPGEFVNGWYGIVPELLTDPKTLRVAVIVFDVQSIKRKVATDEETPVVQIRHVEVATGEHGTAAQEILRALQRGRTGQEQLELTFTPGAVAPPPEPKSHPGEDD